MSAVVYLIRHGRTEGGEEKRYKGHLDVPLSEEGAGQIKRITAYILSRHFPEGGPSKGLGAVYASTLGRAVRSAEIIAGPFGLSPRQVPEFKERNFGRWEGMSFPEIRERYPSEFDAWAADPVRHSPIDGESTLAVRDRVIPAFKAVVGRHHGEEIAIVAHGGVNRIILCEVLGIPLENIFRVEQTFGCLNIIEFFDDLPVVRAMNITA